MKILDLFKKNRNKSLNEAPTVTKSKPSIEKKTISKNNYKNIIVKAPLIAANTERGSLEYPEYDLEEIRNASLADSYIRQALLKQRYTLFKNGYQFKSENEEAIKYLKQRLNIMAFATSKPIDILFQEIGDDFLTYSNAYLIKSRVDSIMPGIKATGFLKDKPVGGYFRADPISMSIDRDKNGKIIKYVQNMNGEEKKFNPEDVIHLYLDREADSAFGTPRILPALEDVKLLRRIEGSVLVLIHRYAMPFFQVKVGLPQVGFQATDPEIDKVRAEVEGMSLDGMLVTNERTDISAIGAEGCALDAQGYLEYFEKRVFTALDTSATQMGRDGSDKNADSMEQQAHNCIKYIQRIFSIFIEFGIFNEILIEGGFNPILNEEDQVKMFFNEINLDTKVKVENHEMLKFQSNMTTFEEMRRNLGLKPTNSFDQLYKNLIEVSAQKDVLDKQSEINLKIAKANQDFQLKMSKQQNNGEGTEAAKKGVSVNGNGKSKSQQPNNDIKNRNTPENQHGKSSAKIKESFKGPVINNKKKHEKFFSLIYNTYEKASNEIEKPEDIEFVISQIEKEIASLTRKHILDYSLKAIEDCSNKTKSFEIKKHDNINVDFIKDDIEKDLHDIFNDITLKLKNIDVNDFNYGEIESIFSVMKYRLRFVLEYNLPKSYWYSYCVYLKNLGLKSAYIDFDGSKDAENHNEIIDLNSFSINDIPPFHPFCDCKVKFKKEVR